MINLDDYEETSLDITKLTSSDKWILDKQNKLIKVVRRHMEKYEFNVVGQELYSFIWNDFCDWYIELAKTNMNNQTKNVLLLVLKNILKMLHPFMPYVTEEIYSKLPNVTKSIMVSDYPQYNKGYDYESDVNNINRIIEIITKIRNVKNENNITSDFVLINNLEKKQKFLINDNFNIFKKLLKARVIDKLDEGMLSIEIPFTYGEVILGYIGKEVKEDIEVLKQEQQKLLSSITRRQKLLSNVGYVNNAPENVVLAEKRKLEEELVSLDIINEKIKTIK